MLKRHIVYRSKLLTLAIIALLIVSACAPVDLDITPSPTPTLEPSPTPTATPLPEGFVEEVDESEAILAALMEGIPNTVPAGAAQWFRDFTRGTDGIEALRGLTNGVGERIYFSEQTGGKMSLNFAIFDTPEEAFANYERIRGIRPVLATGESDDTFPEPNLFGASNQGSYAIFQIDNYFIEVFIELFASTGQNPLKAVSRWTVNYFENNRETFEGAGSDG